MSKGTSTSRCLWKGERNRDDKRKTSVRGYSEIYADYSCTPKPRTFWDVAAHSLVVGQEFALGCYFIARHRVLLTQNLRDPKVNVAQSDKAIYFTLGMVLCASLMARHVPQPNRRAKAKQRLADGVLLAILLRLLAGLWRTLTLSYSSDTVQALAIGGMLLHVLTCDYGWANGKGEFESLKYKQRQPFRGGTLSLNAALFTTTLLVSRLDSQASAFILVGLAIVAFGFYPDTRHVISLAYPASGSFVPWLITATVSWATLCLLQNDHERLGFCTALIALIGILPLYQSWLVKQKVWLKGPWDIPSNESMFGM